MVTVGDVLSRPLFRTAEVVTGSAGLLNAVRWVHVGEIPNLDEFLTGGELVLATGVGLLSPALRQRFVKGLIRKGAAGLILEMGPYLPEVPRELTEPAREAGFPIAVFRTPVRFLDLSQDINSLLLSRHHRILDDLDQLSLKIRQALLSAAGAPDILCALHEATGRASLYVPRDQLGETIMGGEWDGPVPVAREIAWHPTWVREPGPALWQTVMLFERPVGDLWLAMPEAPPPSLPVAVDERDFLALDRTTAALAQDLLRVETVETRRRREDAVLLEHLLLAEATNLNAARRLNSLYGLAQDRHWARIIVLDGAGHDVAEHWRRHLTPRLTVLALEQTDRVIMLVTGRPHVVQELPAQVPPLAPGVYAGLSSPQHRADRIREAFLEAHDAATVAAHLEVPGVRAYEELGLYRWILVTAPDVLERVLIEPELGRLLAHDARHRTALLPTLEALVRHRESKSLAARSLSVHRQTLYSRIALLEQHLGRDFLGADRVVALETALLAYRFLKAKPSAHSQGPEATGNVGVVPN